MSNWAEQIIVAVVIAGIIEMILPNGNSKKYIKAVIGVYILFTILSPILSKITNFDIGDIDYEKYFDSEEEYQAISQDLSSSNNQSVEEIYKSNLKEDMKSKMEEKGYEINTIYIEIEQEDEDNYGKVEEIRLSLCKKEKDATNENNKIEVSKIEKVSIGNTINEANVVKDDLSDDEKEEIKEYLSGVYELNKKNIKVNE